MYVQEMRIFILNNWNELMKFWDEDTQTRYLLQQDNARLHTARTPMTKIQELGGIELLPNPAHCPYIAPSDYHLFRSIAQFLRRRNSENIEAVEVSLTEFFASKTTITICTRAHFLSSLYFSVMS